MASISAPSPTRAAARTLSPRLGYGHGQPHAAGGVKHVIGCDDERDGVFVDRASDEAADNREQRHAGSSAPTGAHVNADALDPLAVLAALGLSGSPLAVPVRGGADTAIWRVDAAGAAYALRVFRPEQAAQARREVAAMRAAAGAGIPVPHVHAVGSRQDRPALLLSWCAGRPLLDELRVGDGRAWALGVQFGRMLATIHAAPVPVALRDHPTPWPAWAGPDEALQTRLRAITPRPEALLHLDYHPLNVLVEGGRVTAVLDWANARLGDPRADLARTTSILRLAPLDPAVPPPVARTARRVFEAGWRRGYRAVAGPIGDLAPFYAWAGAVMARDLAPRLGRPDLPWLTPAYLERVHRWSAYWRRRAGCHDA